MRRRHINEFMKTRFANSGRAAGIGILYDDYSEESYGGYRNSGNIRVRTISEFLSVEERKALNGPVKTYQIKNAKGGTSYA